MLVVQRLKFPDGLKGHGLRFPRYLPWCPPLKNFHRLCDFLMDVPFTGMHVPVTWDEWPCPFKDEVKAWCSYLVIVVIFGYNATVCGSRQLL